MKKLTKKHIRVLFLLNDFGFLDYDFFILIFHSKSNLSKHHLNYKINLSFKLLMDLNYIKKEIAPGAKTYFTLTQKGKSSLYSGVDKVYINNITINSGKFYHSQFCAMVYAKLSSLYQIRYRSENSLSQSKNIKIVPDLAIKIQNSILYFEVERTLKSEKLIVKKLSNYSNEFNDGHLIYLTGNNSIIKKIEKLKYRYQNHETIHAFGLKAFLDDPAVFLTSKNIIQ